MRPARVPTEVVGQRVWESLCSRMDPATHRVRPSWLKMMREIGVCRQRIADVIRTFKAQGKIRGVTVPVPGTDGKESDYYYKIVDSATQDIMGTISFKPYQVDWK